MNSIQNMILIKPDILNFRQYYSGFELNNFVDFVFLYNKYKCVDRFLIKSCPGTFKIKHLLC